MSVNVEGHVHEARPTPASTQDPEISQAAPSVDEREQTITPNQYHLHGEAISVTWYPDGAGPVVAGKGRTGFVYQDASRSLVFGTEEGIKVETSALGTIVTVVIARTVDVGDTTFSLLVPPVVLPTPAGVPVETVGVTTVNRLLAGVLGHPQRSTYTVTQLRGVASAGDLPL